MTAPQMKPKTTLSFIQEVCINFAMSRHDVSSKVGQETT